MENFSDLSQRIINSSQQPLEIPRVPDSLLRPKTYVGQLLILGNGFDRQCGLESSYADFYNDRYPSDVIDKILEIGTSYDISSVGSIYRFNIWDYILVYYFKFKSNESPYEQWSSIEDIIEMVVDDQLSLNIF